MAHMKTLPETMTLSLEKSDNSTTMGQMDLKITPSSSKAMPVEPKKESETQGRAGWLDLVSCVLKMSTWVRVETLSLLEPTPFPYVTDPWTAEPQGPAIMNEKRSRYRKASRLEEGPRAEPGPDTGSQATSGGRFRRGIAKTVVMRGVLAFLCCMVPAFSQFMTQGLVAYWPFEQNGNDASGYGQTAGLSNGVGFTNGVFGYALMPANPVAAPSQYAGLGYPTQITNLTGQFSFSAWVLYKGTNGTGSASVRSSIITRYGATQVFIFDIADTPGKLRLYLNGGNGWVFAQSSVAFPTNQWVHVGATYDGTNGSIYTNGLFCASVAQTGNLPTPNNTETMIGSRVDNTSNYLLHMGAIDELRVYNRALSLQEMALLASSNRSVWANLSGGYWVAGTSLNGGFDAGAGASKIRVFLTNSLGGEILAQDAAVTSSTTWSLSPTLSAGNYSGSVHLVVSNGASNAVAFTFSAVSGRTLTLTSYDVNGAPCGSGEIRSSIGVGTNSSQGILVFSNVPEGSTVALTNLAPLVWASTPQVTQVVIPAGDLAVTWNLASAPATSPASFITQGLVGHWPLDGNGLDVSGFSNHAWLSNVPSFTNGPMGMALVPRYNGGINPQYGRIGTPANLAITFNQLTVAAWVNYTGTNGSGISLGRSSILTKYKGSGDVFLVDMAESPGKLRCNIWTGVSFYTLTSAATFPQNKWVHVAAIYDGTNLSLYTNGVLDCSIPATGTLVSGSTTDMYLGARADNVPGYTWNGGGLDEVRLYNRAIGPDEVGRLAMTGGSFAVTNVHSKGYFPMGEGIQGTVQHASGIRGVYLALTNTNGVEVASGSVMPGADGTWTAGAALPRGVYRGRLWYLSSNNQVASFTWTNLDCRPYHAVTFTTLQTSGTPVPGGRILGLDAMGSASFRTSDASGRAVFSKIPDDVPWAFTNFTARLWNGAELATNLTLSGADMAVTWVVPGGASSSTSTTATRATWWSPSASAAPLSVTGLPNQSSMVRVEVIPLCGGKRLTLWEGILPEGTGSVEPDWKNLEKQGTTGLHVLEISVRSPMGEEASRRIERRLLMVFR